MAELTIGGGVFNVEPEGDPTKPALLISNALGTNLAMWEPRLSALVRHCRVIRYDSRGDGKSTELGAPFVASSRPRCAGDPGLSRDRAGTAGYSEAGHLQDGESHDTAIHFERVRAKWPARIVVSCGKQEEDDVRDGDGRGARQASCRQAVDFPAPGADEIRPANGLRQVVKILAQFVLALGLGCAIPSAAAAAEVVIGIAAPLSGPDAVFGNQIRLGVEQAVADIDAAGGFFRQRDRVVARDDRSDPAKAADVARAFAAEKVSVVIGDFSSAATVAASTIYADAGIPQITPSALAPLVTDRDLATMFRTCGRDDEQADVAARFLQSRHVAPRSDRP